MFDVLTIGTGSRDVFIKSDAFKVVRDPEHLSKLGFATGEAECFALGGKIEIGEPILTVGGGAVNAAITFARQGLKTASLVKLGKDEAGEMILKALKKDRINAIPLLSLSKGTSFSVIMLSGAGERTILNYRGASEELSKNDIPFKRLSAKWVYIVPGKIPFTAISLLVAHLKSQGAKIAMNPSRHYLEMGAKQLKPILSRLDVVIMNREEASYLTGIRFEDEEKIFRKLDELVDGIAVMTDGPNGAMVSDGETIYRAGIFKEKKLVDRTGAGDAFGSGFVAALVREKAKIRNGVSSYSPEAIEKAIRLASANATSVVEVVGAEGGILKKQQFEKERRFRNLKIKTKAI